MCVKVNIAVTGTLGGASLQIDCRNRFCWQADEPTTTFPNLADPSVKSSVWFPRAALFFAGLPTRGSRA